MSTFTQDALAFDVAPLVRPEGATIQERFDSFIVLNAWVIPALEGLAASWLAKGHSRVSTKMLFELLRYRYGVTVGEPWKLNNSFTSRAARLLIEKHPEWSDAIETRELRAA